MAGIFKKGIEEPVVSKTEEPEVQMATLAVATVLPGSSTIIAKGTILVGRMEALGDVELYGHMSGDIVCRENLKILGRLQGNASGSEAVLSGCTLEGDLTVKRGVTMDKDSTVQGNIKAESMIMDGSVRGDLIIEQSLEVKEHAILAGNAASGHVTFRDGAMMVGEMRTTSVDWDKMFQDFSESKK